MLMHVSRYAHVRQTHQQIHTYMHLCSHPHAPRATDINLGTVTASIRNVYRTTIVGFAPYFIIFTMFPVVHVIWPHMHKAHLLPCTTYSTTLVMFLMSVSLSPTEQIHVCSRPGYVVRCLLLTSQGVPHFSSIRVIVSGPAGSPSSAAAAPSERVRDGHTERVRRSDCAGGVGAERAISGLPHSCRGSQESTLQLPRGVARRQAALGQMDLC
jgi:hypothetical protein